MARKKRQQLQFERAVAAHARGDLDAAMSGYRRLLAARSRDHEVAHQLGLALWQEGRLDEALPLLETAVRQAPGAGRYWGNLGNARQSAGRLGDAIAAYAEAVALEPARHAAWSGMGVALRGLSRLTEAVAALRKAASIPGAGAAVWQNLGSALSADGQHAEAADALRTAAAMAPSDGETHNALGNSLVAIGQRSAAQAAYRRAIQCCPDSAVFHTNLGILLARTGASEAAMGSFEDAIAQDASYVDAYTHLGLVLRACGHVQPAVATWQRGLSVRPTPEAWLNLAVALLELGHVTAGVQNLRNLLGVFPDDVPALLALAGALVGLDEHAAAKRRYTEALDRAPGHPEALHFLDALQDRAPARAPASYVRTLFDGYASRFDQHLVGELGYRTPQRLAELIAAVHPGPLGRVCDLGCGTGLMGALLAERCDHLQGIDLSGEMIAQAERKGHYDALHLGDIEAVLATLGAQDLLVATDVVIYIGDLSGLFAQAAASLVPGGLLALTTEHIDGEGWRLLSSGRYAHSATAIAVLAEAHGLVVLREAVAPIRQERGAWLDGGLYVLRTVGSGQKSSG
ncbi:MAG: tetratricopeptide repeat protein [Myxococcota bacterium]|nr:tetratricopeptide repeat protein [Myxococcota bacterium]